MTTVGCLPPQQAHDAVGDHGEQRAEQRHGRQGKREEKPPRSNSMSADNRPKKGARTAAETAPPTRTRSIPKTIREGPNASIASTIHCRALPEPVNSGPRVSLGWQRASASLRPPCTLIPAAGCWGLSSASMCVWVKKSEEDPPIPTFLCVRLFPVSTNGTLPKQFVMVIDMWAVALAPVGRYSTAAERSEGRQISRAWQN